MYIVQIQLKSKLCSCANLRLANNIHDKTILMFRGVDRSVVIYPLSTQEQWAGWQLISPDCLWHDHYLSALISDCLWLPYTSRSVSQERVNTFNSLLFPASSEERCSFWPAEHSAVKVRQSDNLSINNREIDIGLLTVNLTQNITSDIWLPEKKTWFRVTLQLNKGDKRETDSSSGGASYGVNREDAQTSARRDCL